MVAQRALPRHGVAHAQELVSSVRSLVMRSDPVEPGTQACDTPVTQTPSTVWLRWP